MPGTVYELRQDPLEVLGVDLDRVVVLGELGCPERRLCGWLVELVGWTGLRSLGQGRTRGGEGRDTGDLVSMVSIHATQQTEATISLSTEALWTARITSGSAGALNPEHKERQKCFLAVLKRGFTREGFKMSLLVPNVPGTPPLSELADAFGEADDCRRDSARSVHSTAEQDRRYYTYLQRALQVMQVIAAPDLDVGFASGVHWFSEAITSFVANGTPMAMTTRAISRFLLQAQRQRNQEMLFADDSGEEMLCFKETEAITLAKAKLLDWDRDTQVDQQIQWRRCLELSNEKDRGHGKYGARQNGGTGGGESYPTKASGSFAKTKAEGEYGGKSSTMHVNYNKIDKKVWQNTYGETRANGKVVLLCWYHSNRPGGCVRHTECPHDHNRYPTAYKGRALEKCDAPFQKEVLRKCSS